ncbi:endolytic transglycosylase MltG [Candidatus Curtissbacteria bacterium]|nr:endolytic transglycosylase MltG [Candidatus Curtissbacteria bacterium]
MKKLPIFAIIFIILILTPVAFNQYYNYQLQAPSTDSTLMRFVIKPGQPVTQIAKNLKEAGLVKNALAFRLLVAQMGIGKNIQAGDFRLAPNMPARDLAGELTHGAIDIWITFPEGLRVEEIAEIVQNSLRTAENEKYAFDKKEFIKIAEEGYMFPDTYLIAKDATAADIATRLRTTFDEKVDEKLLTSGSKNNLTSQDLVILASLIEREAKTNQERPVIAGILVNRLNAGIALQVDATVQYAKGYDSAKNSWWPAVSPADYDSVDSLYNTYLHPGLPPTPIANPGLESIRAAAEPADTDYLYYLHDSDGKIHYAETIEEHNKNIKDFL